jgi:hypothetical protein
VSARSTTNSWQIAGDRGPVVLVTAVGGASGARAAAAALACAASEPDRAALLIDLGEGRPPRSTLIATTGARALEERLSAHLPDVRIASRGQICQLCLLPEPAGIEQIAAATPLVRESAAVVHLPPSLVRPVLEEPRTQATAVLLRADLAGARALTALAVRDLMAQGLRVSVLKQPPSWLTARTALLGIPQIAGSALPMRFRDRLLRAEDNKLRKCYDRMDEAADDPQASDGIDR